jgi:hypothetical protein
LTFRTWDLLHEKIVELSHGALLRAERLPALDDVLHLGRLLVRIIRIDVVAVLVFVLLLFVLGVFVDVWKKCCNVSTPLNA